MDSEEVTVEVPQLFCRCNVTFEAHGTWTQNHFYLNLLFFHGSSVRKPVTRNLSVILTEIRNPRVQQDKKYVLTKLFVHV